MTRNWKHLFYRNLSSRIDLPVRLGPCTKANDDNPLDILVIYNATTFPSIVLTCRIIGILQIEQGGKARSSGTTGLFAVPQRSQGEDGLRDVRHLSKPIQQEL
jgi:inorganic pyrophosphatase